MQASNNSVKKTDFLEIVKYIYIGISSLLVLFPVYFLVISSLKTDNDIFTNPFGFPQKIMWENYGIVLFKYKLYLNLANSLYYSLISLALIVVVGVLASYALTRMNWKFRKMAFALLMTGMLVPMHAVILPLYLSVRKMGITSPRFILVAIFAVFAIPKSVFILSGFLKDMPRSVEEAAVIDGASIFQVLTRVVVPILRPAIATICIFDFLSIWNDLLIGLIFINKDVDKTIQLGIMKFKGDYVTIYNYVLAGILIAIIPTITMYLFFQKQIISGITAGAVKG